MISNDSSKYYGLNVTNIGGTVMRCGMREFLGNNGDSSSNFGVHPVVSLKSGITVNITDTE